MTPPPKLASSVKVWTRPPKLSSFTRFFVPISIERYDGSIRQDGCPTIYPAPPNVEVNSKLNSAKETSPSLGFNKHPPVGFHPGSPGKQSSTSAMLLLFELAITRSVTVQATSMSDRKTATNPSFRICTSSHVVIGVQMRTLRSEERRV